MEGKIKDTTGKCVKILFSKGDFMIALFNIGNETISVKGNMFVVEGQDYQIKAEHDLSNPKYENSYKAIQVKQDIDFSNADEKVVETFLSSFLTKKQTKEIMNTLDDPIDVIDKKDIKKLTTVKGIGVATAERIVRNYAAQKDYSEAFIAFADFDISDTLVKKICDHFESVSIAIERVKDNPYSLVEVNGVGFKKADWIFLSNPDNDPNDIRRIKAFTLNAFDIKYQEGHTWISPKEYVEMFKENFFGGDFKDGINYIKESDEFVIFDVEESSGQTHKRLALSKIVKMEIECVSILNNLMEAESKMKLNNIDSIVSDIEDAQGWEYSDEQREAINGVFDNNVSMLQGLSGAGKSSVAKAFVSALLQNGYSYLGATLSGKAADNLKKTTGQNASTIHSMLMPSADEGGFYYGYKNKLPTNAVIIDELSMVNLEIFLSVIRSITPGSKLILLGDFGQLEAIGVGVMGSFIRSKKIPMMLLRKIHRQAAKSAIITHSIAYRNGTIPEEVDMKLIGEPQIHGEIEDLEYLFLEDDSEIGVNVLKSFSESLKTFDLQDIQILCSTKSTGAVHCAYLNERAQMIANPSSPNKLEIEVGYKGKEYMLRVGDKVINTKNTRDTKTPEGDDKPIYNGNTGIVTEIDVDEMAVTIDFDGIGKVVVTTENLNNIELGYAITIHKSQGSTIKCVILALPFHYLLNSKELLYTGITRASTYQIVVTTERALRSAVKKSNATKKNVSLDVFLQDYDKWKGLINNEA